MATGFEAKFVGLLVDAFTVDELALLLRMQLNVTFDDIRPYQSTREQAVFALVEWARRENRTGELLRAATVERPNRPEFAALVTEYGPKPDGTHSSGRRPSRSISRLGPLGRKTLLLLATIFVLGIAAVLVNSLLRRPGTSPSPAVEVSDVVVTPFESAVRGNRTLIGANGHEKTIEFRIANVSTRPVTLQAVKVECLSYQETGGTVFRLRVEEALGTQVGLFTLDLARLQGHELPVPIAVLTNSKHLAVAGEQALRMSVISGDPGQWKLVMHVEYRDEQSDLREQVVRGNPFTVEIR